MNVWLGVAAVVVGYVLGANSPAVWLARRLGIDLRSVGSGNPGATNVARAVSPRAAVVVALLDVVKGLAPAAGFGLADHEGGLLAGAAAVIGHVTSPYLRGRGGKGVATTFGAVLGSHPAWALLVLLGWVAVVGVTRWSALGSAVAALVLLGEGLAWSQGWPNIAWAIVLSVIVLARHWPNLRRWLRTRER
ncbi:MAG: acyl phosphate:glycerol-3-phosphate acyltransferase [Frankiales bacterium]|nr:acyl phosphate:glycerol-3-phosphate acyltransferase [Frankiales bacterium]